MAAVLSLFAGSFLLVILGAVRAIGHSLGNDQVVAPMVAIVPHALSSFVGIVVVTLVAGRTRRRGSRSGSAGGPPDRSADESAWSDADG
jgi:hypothetical protein